MKSVKQIGLNFPPRREECSWLQIEYQLIKLPPDCRTLLWNTNTLGPEDQTDKYWTISLDCLPLLEEASGTSKSHSKPSLPRGASRIRFRFIQLNKNSVKS